jgi:hypothetical protein
LGSKSLETAVQFHGGSFANNPTPLRHKAPLAIDDASMAGVASDDVRLILRHCKMPLERQLETERCRHEVLAYLNEATLIRAMGLSFGIFRVGRGGALSLCNFRLELLALKLSIVRL